MYDDTVNKLERSIATHQMGEKLRTVGRGLKATLNKQLETASGLSRKQTKWYREAFDKIMKFTSADDILHGNGLKHLETLDAEWKRLAMPKELRLAVHNSMRELIENIESKTVTLRTGRETLKRRVQAQEILLRNLEFSDNHMLRMITEKELGRTKSILARYDAKVALRKRKYRQKQRKIAKAEAKRLAKARHSEDVSDAEIFAMSQKDAKKLTKGLKKPAPRTAAQKQAISESKAFIKAARSDEVIPDDEFYAMFKADAEELAGALKYGVEEPQPLTPKDMGEVLETHALNTRRPAIQEEVLRKINADEREISKMAAISYANERFGPRFLEHLARVKNIIDDLGGDATIDEFFPNLSSVKRLEESIDDFKLMRMSNDHRFTTDQDILDGVLPLPNNYREQLFSKATDFEAVPPKSNRGIEKPVSPQKRAADKIEAAKLSEDLKHRAAAEASDNIKTAKRQLEVCMTGGGADGG